MKSRVAKMTTIHGKEIAISDFIKGSIDGVLGTKTRLLAVEQGLEKAGLFFHTKCLIGLGLSGWEYLETR